MSDVRMIFETDDTQGDSVSVKTRRGKPDELFLESRDGVYLARQQVTELHTALGEWLASTAPEPEAAPEPIAPELIPGRRYRVGPDPTHRNSVGNETPSVYLSDGDEVMLTPRNPNHVGDVTVFTSSHGEIYVDPRHLTLLPEDEPTDRDVERDAQVAELARVVAEYRLRLDVLDVGTAKALTNAHGRIGRLAARVNQLEADAAKPSPLHQAIADEIRRAAGAR